MDRLVVEHRPPVEARIVRLPQSPAGGAGEVRRAVAGDARDGRHAVSDRTDVPEPEVLEHLGCGLRRDGRGESEERERRCETAERSHAGTSCVRFRSRRVKVFPDTPRGQRSCVTDAW